jgi:ADP-dependent phosphofructokinase/glucokinase
MDYQALYEKYFDQIETDAAKCLETGKRIVLGYTSDLDVVLEWDGDVFSDIVKAYLKEAPRYETGDQIDSMEAFARIVTHFLLGGLGGEVDITAQGVCDHLEAHYKSTYALGGTCAQGAAALSAVGFPVLAYITDRSREVCGLMDRPGMEVYSGGHVVPIAKGASEELPVKHIILQYPKDAAVEINGHVYKAPVSNRLILDYDTIHKRLPIECGFLNFCENYASNIYAYCISGFNGILDPAIMTARLNELTAHYAAVKENNSETMIYLEGAYYLSPFVKDIAFERLARFIDILGMNEEELVEHTARFGLDTKKEEIGSILEGLTCLLDHYPSKGIVMHTKDYALYFGQQLKGIDLTKGLVLGNLMSGTRARFGRYGTREDCHKMLSQPLSVTGLKIAAALESIDVGKYFVAIAPSKYMEHPKYTIGLGDTFTAGMLTAFIH